MTVRRSLQAASVLLGSVLALPSLANSATLAVGDRAPDFTLPDTEGKEIKLSEFRGKKNVVLAFYVLAFTGG